ncbi:MAG: PLP-dependent aminotransferase family protein [Micrococcaceae bacterium]
MARFAPSFELPLTIDRGAPGLPRQLAEQVRALVHADRLRPGDRMPSTRALAGELGLSRGSVSAAYEQLVEEGYLHSTPGGTVVHPRLAPAPAAVSRSGGPPGSGPAVAGQPTPVDAAVSGNRALEAGAPLRPGRPDVSVLTSTAWRAAWRAAAASPSLGYAGPGSPMLREQIAEHLRSVRAVAVDPSALVITAGARDGLRLLLTAVSAHRGSDPTPLTVAVEDPGYPSLHQVPASMGHRVLPLPVDDDGLRVDALPTGAAAPDLVIVTPSHQYPLGSSMSAGRRRDLIRWAQQQRALVVEDDYDSELRYVGDPLPSLAASDTTGRVATLGSFAKLVTPGLGLGYVVVPEDVRAAVTSLTAQAGTPVSGIVQDAMSTFMVQGGLRRHTARMRREYRRRRDAVLEVFDTARTPSSVTVLPMAGGLHAVLQLDDADQESRVIGAARAAGLGVQGLGDYWNRGAGDAEAPGTRPAPMAGVMLGIGESSRQRLVQQLERLRAVLVATL